MTASGRSFGTYTRVSTPALQRARVLRVLVASAVAVGLLAVSPLPAQVATSIKLSSATVIGGESVRVTGSLGQRRARPVKLQQRSGSSWVTTAKSRSTAQGKFEFTYKPPTLAGAQSVVRVFAPRVRISGRRLTPI